MRTVIAVTAVCFSFVGLIAAETVTAAARKTTDIPPQPLGNALKMLANERDFQILYVADVVGQTNTPGARGELTPIETLERLLTGTGLVFSVLDDRTVTIKQPAGEPTPAPRDPAPSKAGSQSVELARGFWSRFRLAQVDEGETADSREKSETTGQGASRTPAQGGSRVEEVVVTGSHIRSNQPTSPVHSVTREDIDRSGFSQVGDLIRSLPENYGGGNNPGIQPTGTEGHVNITNASTANLRGIGPSATLVLLNGRRLAADGTSAAPDISAIPLAALERVEVVTDGASALYGSDAVAGVVNFITRKDFQGSEVSARVGGATQGGGLERTLSGFAGTTWGSGNAMGGVEYLHQDAILASQRAFTADAAPINSLLGAQKRGRAFVNLEQRLSSGLTLQLDGLYSQGQVDSSSQEVATGYPYMEETDVRSYLLTPAISIDLAGGWNASLAATISDSLADRNNDVVRNNSFQKYQNSSDSIEVSANGPLLRLPSGEMQLAFGGGYREDEFRYSTRSAADDVRASRNVRYLFAEISAPLVRPSSERRGLNRLDISVAARLEEYSDFGQTSNPKIGIRYVPSSDLTLRATWGDSFKAPTFMQMYADTSVFQYEAAALGSSVPGLVLFGYGGNSDLQPEQSTSWTAGIDWSPAGIESLAISATYFDIDYKERIVRPISSLGTIFTDPAHAPFITLDPSLSDQAAILDAADRFFNVSSSIYDPSQVVAILRGQWVNASVQTINGVDLSVRKSLPAPVGGIDLFANASWLKIDQQNTTTVAAKTLTGNLFQPPRVRTRAGATWNHGGFASTVVVSHVSSEMDVNVIPSARIASWTTVDMNLAYRFPEAAGAFSGLEASVSVSNALDRDPPFARGASVGFRGIYFDSTNASVIGRFVALTLRKGF